MMSHYGLPYEFNDHWICGSLELSIETLTGTAFEIKVSPNDTIMSIKSKIQSVEGIPVSQQHLLYNLEELDNSASVRDYSIQNGSTLKLVLSMRVGPISTKRLPPVDEIALRELQELMSDTHREDLFEKLPSGSKVTVLIFRNGEQVNLLRVIENDDGSFSPLSESWHGTSIRNLFAEEDPEESAKRLQENSVTMGKVQELKERLETLSIQRKEKKCEESNETESSKSQFDAERDGINENRKMVNFNNSPTGDFLGQPSSLKLGPETRSGKSPDRIQETFRPRRRLVPFPNVPMPGLSEARKEAETIIRMQSKLSVFVDSDAGPSYGFKRPPLPEIRRSPSSDRETDKKVCQDEKLEKSVREKTTRSFAILEEEMNDLAPAPSICSSQSSIVALPSSEEVAAAIAFSPVSRERVSTTVNRSRYKLSRYVLAKDERPKTTPGKMDHGREGKAEQYCESIPAERESLPSSQSTCPPPPLLSSAKRASHILTNLTNMFPTRGLGRMEADDDRVLGRKRTPSTIRKPSYQEQLLRALTRPKSTTTTTTTTSTSSTTTTTSGSTASESKTNSACTTTVTAAAPLVKKRLRCSQCRKKLNITNTYNCRCGGLFCAVHRYSEVHDCLFDYKQEGRKLLQQMNPLIAASKLPKI